MLLAIPGYSLIADGSNYWRSRIRQWQCSSPQGLACPGASADFANTDEQILLLPFSGLAAETCLTKKQRVSMCLTDPGRGRASSKLADLGPILEGIVGGYFEKLAGG